MKSLIQLLQNTLLPLPCSSLSLSPRDSDSFSTQLPHDINPSWLNRARFLLCSKFIYFLLALRFLLSRIRSPTCWIITLCDIIIPRKSHGSLSLLPQAICLATAAYIFTPEVSKFLEKWVANFNARMHQEFDIKQEKDVAGGILTTDEKSAPVYDSASNPSREEFDDGFEYPTEEEVKTLRHVPYCTTPTYYDGLQIFDADGFYSITCPRIPRLRNRAI